MAKRNRRETESTKRPETETAVPHKRSAAEISVLIICAIITAVATVTAAILATHRQTTIEVRRVPTFDLADVTKYFPLKKGNYWIYRGTVRHTTTDAKVEEVRVTVQMKVIDLVRSASNPDVLMFIMQGHPSDAMAPDSPISKYAYIVVSNKILEVNNVDLAKELILKDGVFAGSSQLDALDIAFEFPLFKGQRFGDLGQITRGDLRYFWYVEEESEYDEPIQGKIQRLTTFKLVSNSQPDAQAIWFRPYFGITEYNYVHHGGTTIEVHLSLEDYDLQQ